MMPLLRNLASVAVLAATGVLLIADSAPDCEKDAQEVTFDVTENTCGGNGSFQLRVPEDSCDLTAVGNEPLGFPEYGGASAKVDLKRGDWSLHDRAHTLHVDADGGVVRPDAGGTAVDGNRHCEATREAEHLRLTCIDRRSDLSGVEVFRCEAKLTPR
jgi:hypothetical protein|nr:hypothetical protein MFMH1_71280 [Myxococcus sp. MH1]